MEVQLVGDLDPNSSQKISSNNYRMDKDTPTSEEQVE